MPLCGAALARRWHSAVFPGERVSAPAEPISPRPAATLVLVRDANTGLEVFMIRRSPAADFVSGAYAFPGGGLDACDASPELAGCCEGLDDVEASHLLGVERGGLAYWIAAIRECFEEAGLLLAHDAGGKFADLNERRNAVAFSGWRRSLQSGNSTLADLCRERRLCLSVGRLAYFSHWITQVGPPRRYDTRFFVAVTPAAQTPSHDETETVDHVWIRPVEALERRQRGEWRLVFPTIKTLESIGAFDNASVLMEFAQKQRTVPAMMSRVASNPESPAKG